MAWIELHQTLPRHPKLIRLASRLRIPRAQAAGHLTFLWLWALDYAPGGSLAEFGPTEISTAADFPGDAEDFAGALLETGWLDEGLRIHDWDEYAGRLIAMREGNRQRQRNLRLRHAHVTRDSRVTNALVTALHNPTQPDQTIREGGDDRSGDAGEHTTEPPKGFPKTEADARAQAGVWGVDPDLAARAFTIAASRGWRDAKNVPIRSWPHYVAFCQNAERSRVAERSARNGNGKPGARGTPEPKQIQETIALPIIPIE